MKILISSLGTRGDIQPYVALAVGLQESGHRVTLAAPHTFAGWIESYGVSALPLQFNPGEMMKQPEAQAALKSGNPVRQFRLMRAAMNTGAVEAMDEFWRAAQDTDFVVQSGTGVGGVECAGQLGLPMAFAYLLPFPATRSFPSFFLPVRASLGGGYNYLTHILMQRMLWSVLGGPLINGWRTTRLKLPPWRSAADMYNSVRPAGTPWLFGYSPHVLPKPPDWADYHHVNGYWFLGPPPGWQPPAELLRFLESGPPPVCVGFGSMGGDQAQHQTRLILQALELAGQRGVLLAGSGAINRLADSPNVYFADDVPHSWLFPRVAAVVHHGGAGSTAAGLLAGVPSIVAPFVGDQLVWADLVAHLGVGPRAGPIKKLTAEELAEAIRTSLFDAPLRARAAALGEKIRADNGVARAVELIERHAQNSRARQAA